MTEAPFEIWVGNLAAYTEGRLVGEWIPLPQKEERLDEAIAKISKNRKDEIIIMDYSIRSNCRFMRSYINEWDNVKELNTIARLIGDEAHRKVEAYLENDSGLSLLEIANLFMQEDEISFYPYEFEGSDNMEVMDILSNEEKMGYTILESNMELKKQLESMQIHGASVLGYLDVGAIGRDYSYNNATLYEDGYYNMSENELNLKLYTMKEIEEEIAEREQSAEEKKEEETQEEEIKEGTIKEKVQHKITEKAPSL